MDNILFSYEGWITQNIIHHLLNTLNCQLSVECTETNISRNASIIAIEQLQNILHYSKGRIEIAPNQFKSFGSFRVTQSDYSLTMTSINVIDKTTIEKIDERISHVNQLSPKEQRAYMRTLMRTAEHKHDKGAGLGFLTMAKKSVQPLTYSFDTQNDLTYFKLSTTLQLKETNDEFKN
jgi:hypothetical protein